jgi:RNA recognition motif-containing protein
MKIYVGNLPRVTSEDELRKAFEAHGEVTSAVNHGVSASLRCRTMPQRRLQLQPWAVRILVAGR